jgi:hypothetical protein
MITSFGADRRPSVGDSMPVLFALLASEVEWFVEGYF